ncbi:MAG: hypothetical protein RLZZ370_1835 [Bacteroidota bacterium]
MKPVKGSFKWIRWSALLLLLFMGAAAYFFFSPQIATSGSLHISRGSSTAKVAELLHRKFGMKYGWFFKGAAYFMGYRKPNAVKVQVEKGMSIFDLVRLLNKNKRQTVNVVIRSGWSQEQLISYLTSKLEPEKEDWVRVFQNSSLLDSFSVHEQGLLTLFIPDTYNMYYAGTAEEMLKRFAQKSVSFWNAHGINMDSAVRVYTLASIVEKESQQGAERPIIAGVYLNRLKKGMKLQADPTVNFAIGAWRALYFKDLEVESPYNTYQNYGLPPGPICVSSVQSIESVLKPAAHPYLFFVAKGDGSGFHRFSEGADEHYRNIALRKKELRGN